MIISSSSRSTLEPTPCGCEVDGEAFCNFDDGTSGYCEPCSSFRSADDCKYAGLPDAGAVDCISRCVKNIKKGINSRGLQIKI